MKGKLDRERRNRKKKEINGKEVKGK